MTPQIGVLVVNYNSGPHLARCIAGLRDQTISDFEVVVVDNGSRDDSLARARLAAAGDARFTFDEVGENLGFAKGNSRASARATAPWLATLNPDAFAERDWLARLLEGTRRYPDADMFGSTQIGAHDPKRLDGFGDAYLAVGLPWRGGFGHPLDAAREDCEVFSPCAAAALYRATRFRLAGGFDEAFFCYCEDVDLGFRLRLMGSRCVQLRHAVVVHVGGGSSADSSFARYHGTRNMIWTFVKNMPAPLFWLLLPLHLFALALMAAKAGLRGDFRTFARAARDAIEGLPGAWVKRRAVQRGRLASASAIARALCWNPAVYLGRGPFPLGPASRTGWG